MLKAKDANLLYIIKRKIARELISAQQACVFERYLQQAHEKALPVRVRLLTYVCVRLMPILLFPEQPALCSKVCLRASKLCATSEARP